jgi:LAO/AO transport system kinase
MLTLGHGRTMWKPPIVRTSAQDGSGIEELIASIDAHAEWAAASGELETRRAGAAREEVEALLREALVKRLEDRIGHQRVTDAVARVAKRELDPYRAVDELLK